MDLVIIVTYFKIPLYRTSISQLILNFVFESLDMQCVSVKRSKLRHD